MNKLTKIIYGFLFLAVLTWSVPASANMSQIKAYKEAFADTKPKCIDCHKDERPKKDDGQHDPNDYGAAVIKAAGTDKPSVDTYNKVGKIEDFLKKVSK